jgi:hypothetical protein
MMKTTKRISVLSCLFIAAFAAVLSVGTVFADVEELTLEQLVTRADRIVRGSVVGLESQWDEDHALIYTSVTVSVRDCLRGERPSEEVTIKVPGGVVGELGLTVSHAPTFMMDEDVILFLQGQEIVGWSHGKLTIVGSMVVEKGIPVNEFIGQVHAILRDKGIPIGPSTPKGLTQPATRLHQESLPPEAGGSGVDGEDTKVKPGAVAQVEQGASLAAWSTIMTEDFESSFPGTEWTLLWNTTSSAGGWGYTWDDDPYRYHNGSSSGWCADGQYESNPDISAPGPYPNDMRAWTVYGPFDLSDATAAELLFYHWTDTEATYDYLFVGASINGSNFYGSGYSGNWASSCGGWCSENFDLANVYTLGNLCGQSQVWIAFKFHSDSSITDEGSYLDDITLQKQIGGALPHIDSINPDHGPAHADELGECGCAADSTQVTINGSNFGATQGTSYVRFWREGSTYYNACVDSWSDTQIVARVPGCVSSGDVVVVTGAGTSNAVYFTVTYSYGGGKWPSGSYPQPMSEVYKVNASSGPSGALAAIQAGATTWDEVDCADFLFRYGGASTASTTAYDGENTILWEDLASGILGVNSSWWFTADPHTIIEFDIGFNTDYSWGTDCGAGYYDIQSIAAHELGHTLQLLDVYGTADTAKVMYGMGSSGTCKRDLLADDEAGICYIYPCSAPAIPSGPSPTDNATGVLVTADLDWADASGATSYDVYFGTAPSPPLDGNTASSSYSLPTLNYGTHYYWKIVAKNSCGDATGPVWDFTTCTLPGTPSAPSPSDGATDISLNADLDWADASGATSYDVYFGTSPTPTYYSTTVASELALPRLDASTQHYWQIVAKNSCGNTSGPVWDFTTSMNHAPTNGTISPSSGSGSIGVTIYFTTTWSDADGWEDLKQCYFHIGASPSILNNVTLLYNAAKDKLWLRSDDGTAWTGGYAPGSANVLENSQAKVYCALTTMQGLGNTAEVKWAIEFKPGYIGAKKTGLKCKDVDKAKAKGQWIGTWTIY